MEIIQELPQDQLTAIVEELKNVNSNLQRGEGVEIKGVGFIDGATMESIRAADRDKKVTFVVIGIPALQALRIKIGLPLKDFHVTLGFENGDIHLEVIGKDENGKDITDFITKRADPTYEKYNSLIPDLKFTKLTGQEKRQKQPKKQIEKKTAEYNPEVGRVKLSALSEADPINFGNLPIEDFITAMETNDNKKLGELRAQYAQSIPDKSKMGDLSRALRESQK